jgi:Flp pilus assembly pilin Flp
MTVLQRFWADNDGFVISTELVLVATTLVVGMLVGLVTVRDQVVQELGDVALAIGNVNQSYEYEGVTGHTSATAGSNFLDRNDFCEPVGGEDQGGSPPLCINVQAGNHNEGEAPTATP